MLIDTGGSDAIWLFEDNGKKIEVPPKHSEDFLDRGISGRVYGKRAKIETFEIAGYKLRRVNVAFPDSTSISFARRFKERNGSIAGNVLKRFNLVLDYQNSSIKLNETVISDCLFTTIKVG